MKKIFSRGYMLALSPLALVTGLVAIAAPASAHIAVTSHTSRDGDEKAFPCEGRTRGSGEIYTYRPGETINITINEYIPHPGYFRVSFDSDGEDDFVIPAGTSAENGTCGGAPECGPGNEDYCSNDTVLLDGLDPHAAAASKGNYTWSVTLPNVECDNCTLQVMQMMDDMVFVHDPANYPEQDIYWRCIDIVLSNDAPEVDDAPVENNGMTCESAMMAGDEQAPINGDADPTVPAEGEVGDGTGTDMTGAPAEPSPGAADMTAAPMGDGAMPTSPTTPVPSGDATPAGMAPAAPVGAAAPSSQAPTPTVGANDTAGTLGAAPSAGMPAADPVAAAPTTTSDSGGCSVAAGDGRSALSSLWLALGVACWLRRRRA